MMKRVIFVLAIALATGCHRPAPSDLAKPPEVTVMKPEKKPVQESIDLSGTCEAYRTVNFVARVEGTLTSVNFKDGGYVEQGDLLFTIEQDTYQQQLALYEAQLENAESEYQRQLNLSKQNATSVSAVENWKSQRDQARAQVELAKINLGYTRISAPFAGRMGKHLADAGNLVGGPGGPTQLGTLQQLQPIYVSFNMNEREVLRAMEKIRASGAVVKSAVGTLPVYAGLSTEAGYPHKGVLEFAANEVDTASGTVELRAEFANDEKLFFPGLFARIRIPFGEPAPMLAVPNRAVSNDQAGDYVLTVDAQDRVVRKNVETGPLTGGGMRAIASGLTANDRVIIEGIVDARIGAVVTPVSPPATTPAPSPAAAK